MVDTPAARAARQRRASGAVTDFDSDRLALARRLARMPRTVLAASTSVTAAAITQYERGQTRPTAPVLAELARALEMPAEFFRRGEPVQPLPASLAHFRSLRATPAAAREQALAFAEVALIVTSVIEQHVDLPPVLVQESPVLEDDNPAAAAQAAIRTRAAMGLPPGPVPNVVELLEDHGVLVLRLPPTVDRGVDAFSTRAGRRPLVLLSPAKDDRARSRFDAAHELGHLVMHLDAEPGSRLIENQANVFAAEFLMPADQVAADLPRTLDWKALHAAKRHWGTSLSALLRRAHTLQLISDHTYRRGSIELAQRGYPEAGPLGPPQSPTLLGSVVDLLAEHGTTLDDLAAAAQLPLQQVQQVIDAGRDTRPQLGRAPRWAP